jgi:hypothetical protein
MMLKFNRQVRFKIYCVVSLTLFFNKFIFFNFVFYEIILVLKKISVLV